MKKYIGLLKALTALLIFAGLTSLLLLSVGCSSNQNFLAQTYTISNNKVKSLAIKVYDREVNVNAVASNEIKISYFTSSKEFYNLALSETNDLQMQSAYDKSWIDYVGTKTPLEYRKINIDLPIGFLTSLLISTTNEKITCNTLEVNDSISFINNGGDFDFSQVIVGNNLSVNVKNGNTNGSIKGEYDQFLISCEIKKGTTNLPLQKESGDKSLNVKSNNGDVKIIFVN